MMSRERIKSQIALLREGNSREQLMAPDNKGYIINCTRPFTTVALNAVSNAVFLYMDQST